MTDTWKNCSILSILPLGVPAYTAAYTYAELADQVVPSIISNFF